LPSWVAQGGFATHHPEEGAGPGGGTRSHRTLIDQRYATMLLSRTRRVDRRRIVRSYNMPAKGRTFDVGFTKAPQDLRMNQRLAALHTRAGRFSEAAFAAAIWNSLSRCRASR